MCIAKLQMRKSRHIPGGSSFVTAEVKKKPPDRPPEKDDEREKGVQTHKSIFFILANGYICVSPSSLFMLIFFGEDLRLEIYEIVFPSLLSSCCSIRHLLDLNQPRLREGRQQPAGRQDSSDNFNYMISTFFSLFLKK